eukprot:4995245-Pleurochrysis_carterae.AAC.1
MVGVGRGGIRWGVVARPSWRGTEHDFSSLPQHNCRSCLVTRACCSGGRSQLSAGEALRLKPFAGASSWALRNAGPARACILSHAFRRMRGDARARACAHMEAHFCCPCILAPPPILQVFRAFCSPPPSCLDGTLT